MNILEFGNRITDVWDYPKLSIYNNQINTEKDYFNFLNSASKSDMGVRIYIHIPFCKSFCSFCQFYKEPYKENEDFLDDYFNNVINELQIYANTPYMKSQIVTSVFFGGGDPSIIKYKYFRMIMDAIYQKFRVCEKPSISVEGNVKNLLNEDRLKMYKEYGVSRISFGVQTFNEEIRKRLLIKPTLEEIDNVVELIRKVGIESYAFDLMYNLPDQTTDDIRYDIEKADRYKSDYIDFYSLNLYPNTIFFDDIYKREKFNIKPSKNIELEHNKLIKSIMTDMGYNQVISCTYSRNYTKPHHGLYHYLIGGNMLGLGPSARSYLDGKAFRNVCSIKSYNDMLENNQKPIETGTVIDEQEQKRRLAILSVTLFEIDKKIVEQVPDVKEKLNQMIKLGYIKTGKEKYYVTAKGNPWIGNIQKALFSDNMAAKDVSNFLHAIKDGRSAYNQDYMSINKKVIK